MPAADDLISDFDDYRDTLPPPEPSEPIALPAKKGKKKKKQHVAQTRARLDEEEDTPYAKSVTPSPPAHLGVRLDTPPLPPDLLVEADPELEDIPIAEERDELHPFAYDDETT
ncbi:hypothetical protein LTR53_009267, partial [Teratosphaeriaceae sp. CCFEE 6253]